MLSARSVGSEKVRRIQLERSGCFVESETVLQSENYENFWLLIVSEDKCNGDRVLKGIRATSAEGSTGT